MHDNPYEVLGLPRDANERQIVAAYRNAALKYHPDKQQSGDSQSFLRITEAYQVLIDVGARAACDAVLEARRARSEREERMNAEARVMRTDLLERERLAGLWRAEERKAEVRLELERERLARYSAQAGHFGDTSASKYEVEEDRTAVFRWDAQGASSGDLRTLVEAYGRVEKIEMKKSFAIIVFWRLMDVAQLIADVNSGKVSGGLADLDISWKGPSVAKEPVASTEDRKVREFLEYEQRVLDRLQRAINDKL